MNSDIKSNIMFKDIRKLLDITKPVCMSDKNTSEYKTFISTMEIPDSYDEYLVTGISFIDTEKANSKYGVELLKAIEIIFENTK